VPGSGSAAGPAPVPADEVYPVSTSAEAVTELGADPLQRSAQRLFWAAVAGAAGFALLAVLLTLMRTVPERAALLARLRTMGLRRRQGVALILAETLPQTLAATLGGALVAAAAVALLGPAMDLSTLVGAQVPNGVRLTAGPVLTQALGLAALVAAAVFVEAATSGRRQITTELRAGDQR
ncbi:FtsX-like permease family protein, partial [Streptomyces avidinii]